MDPQNPTGYKNKNHRQRRYLKLKADFQKCQQITSCTDFMIGRGALRNPYLFSEIKSPTAALPATASLKLISGFYDACVRF